MRPSDNFQHQFQRQWSSPLKWSAIFFFVSADKRFSSSALISRWSAIFVLVSAFFFVSDFLFVSGYGYHYQCWSALLIPITHITADQRWWKRKSLISSSDFISGDDRWWAVMIIGADQRWKLAEGSHHHASWPLISGFLFRPGWSFSSALIVSAFLFYLCQRWSVLFFFVSDFLFCQRCSAVIWASLSALISGATDNRWYPNT